MIKSKCGISVRQLYHSQWNVGLKKQVWILQALSLATEQHHHHFQYSALSRTRLAQAVDTWSSNKLARYFCSACRETRLRFVQMHSNFVITKSHLTRRYLCYFWHSLLAYMLISVKNIRKFWIYFVMSGNSLYYASTVPTTVPCSFIPCSSSLTPMQVIDRDFIWMHSACSITRGMKENTPIK